jgi:hypothetical protein
MATATSKNKNNVLVNTHLVDVITPQGLEFHQSDFWFGEQLARVIVVTNYPPRVRIGWLSRIANMEGVTCSIHLNPTEPGKLIQRITKSIGELGGRLQQGGNALTVQRTEQQYKDANKLLKLIDQEQENVFYVTVAIMVMASDKDELNRKSKKIESALAGSKMKGRGAMFKQEESLLAVGPYGMCPTSVSEISSRNMPVSTIAGAYPFNSSGLNDGTGYIFGIDALGGLILLDTWKRGDDRTNANWTVLGLPGVGKSTAVKHIFLNEWCLGTKIIIIDPEREYKDMCENLKGQWINCGGGKGGRINPLQVRNVPLDEEDEKEPLYKDEGKGLGALALHFQNLRTFFKLSLKDIDAIDYALLEEVLEELYTSKGITWDTDIKLLKNADYPIMEELYNLLVVKSEDETIKEKRRERYDKLAVLLRSAAIGADSALWNGYTTVEPNSDFIVMDTHELQDADLDIKRAQYFNILTWTWQYASEDREEEVLVGVDEAYLLVDPQVPQTLIFLRNFSKRIRKYGGGLAVISHSVVDFLHETVRQYGQALMDNPSFKFFMGTDGKNLEELTQLMKLTEAEQEMLAKKKRGHGLLIAGSKRIHAKVELADHEISIFGKGGGK